MEKKSIQTCWRCTQVEIDFGFIKKAVEAVEIGTTTRMDSTDKKIKVYKCGSVIRIDIKEE